MLDEDLPLDFDECLNEDDELERLFVCLLPPFECESSIFFKCRSNSRVIRLR